MFPHVDYDISDEKVNMMVSKAISKYMEMDGFNPSWVCKAQIQCHNH